MQDYSHDMRNRTIKNIRFLAFASVLIAALMLPAQSAPVSPTTVPVAVAPVAIPVLPTTPRDANTWTDRRPLFAVQLRQVIDQHVGGASLTTPAGIQAAQKAWLQEAADVAARAIRCHVQGIVVWDLSLDQINPDLANVSWVGDPRLVHPAVAPIIDQFFATFTKSGIRTGVCIRHGEIVKEYGGATVRVPGNGIYCCIAKSNYARLKWGCSIFYIDSNQANLMDTTPAGTAYNWTVQVPNSLAIFEQVTGSDYIGKGFRYWDCGNGSVPTTLAGVPTLIANFSAIDAAHHADVVKCLKAGDMLICNGWYDNNDQVVMAKLEHDAGLN